MRNLILISAFCLILITSCNRTDPEKGVAVARVYDSYLYESDLVAVTYPGITKYDSLVRVNAFINNWIRQQVLLNQAKKNLDLSQRDFSKQLEEYENSLITFTYESELINQNLDTIITEEEIQQYYSEHEFDFELHHNIVKAVFVAVPSDFDAAVVKRFSKEMGRKDTVVLDTISAMVERYAVPNYLDMDSWIRFDDLLERVPLEVFNQESFLKKNVFVSFEHDSFIYMVRFCDFLVKESVSPIEIERDKIRSILLNKRRKELLRNMSNDIYEKAVREKAIELFNK